MSDIFDEIARDAERDVIEWHPSRRDGELFENWLTRIDIARAEVSGLYARKFREHFTTHPEDIARALPDDYFGRDRPFIRRDDLMLVLRVPTPRDPPH